MAWFGDTFGDGLSNLKGQITKLTKEVLSDDPLAATSFEGRIKDLEKLCTEQLGEIETLRCENKRHKDGNSFELTEDQIQKICEYENRITELEAEKSELMLSLDRIEEEHAKEMEVVIRDRDELRAKLPNSTIPSNNEQFQELSTAFNNIQLQSDILFEENKSKDSELKKYYEENEKLKKMVAELELRLEQQLEKTIISQETFESLKIENNNLKEMLESVHLTDNDKIDQLTTENKILKNNHEEALQKIEELGKQSENQKLLQDLEELRQKLDVALSQKEKFEFKEATFLNKLQESEKKIQQLNEDNKELVDNIEILKTSTEEYLKQRDDYEEKLKKMETLVQRTEERENLVSSSLACEIRALKTLVSRIRTEFLPPADQQTENTEEATQSQTDDVKRLLQDVSQMTDIIKTISQGLSEINQEKTRLEKEVEILKTLSTRTEHELSINIKAKQQLEANVLEWAAAVTGRDEMIKNLSMEKTATEHELSNVKLANNELGCLNQNLSAVVEASAAKIQELELKLTESSRVAEEWKTRLDALQGIYENDSKRAEALNKNKDELLEEFRKRTDNDEPGNEHQDQISRLLDENSDLKTLIQQLRENIFALNTRDVNKNPQQHRRSHSQTDETTTDIRYQALVSENQSLVEKEKSLQREVERLRAHLVDVEDHYTEQAMNSETQLTQYRNKLAVLEDQLRNSSNIYKSANVRSTQQVEALQAQISLIDVERKDLQNKLSYAEDHSQKQAAALASLQLVLEQFQLDKKREIQMLVEKHAYQIELEQRQVKETEGELENVRQQLAEAKNGLKAALRLGEQLEKKTQLVNELQQDLQKSKEELSAVEKKLTNICESTAAKIDKSIIKNLVVGYLTAQGDHKIQALKILSSVLELTQEERTRAGVEVQSGWLSHLRSPVSGSSSAQGESLSQAFVRFLESESRPQPKLKLLPEPISQTPPKRTPLVLTDLVLPSMTPTSITETNLGQVLNDS